jgi:gliding motility-associated-like protein
LGEVQNVNELPNPFFTRSQQVTVSFTKRINPSCTQVYTLDFRVNSLPELGNNEVVVRCLNTPPEPIGLITDFPELYTYTWAFINSEGDRILLSNDSATILPESPGTYEMTATTLDGTPCSLTKIITVSDSSSATIDASFFVLDDLNQDKTNSLQIITDNLGIGDYEFSITPENESYQDEPYFEDIPNGVFTLFIQDKNGCGISTYQSVALGYPKFFSPNGDGINDFWTVEGISLDYFPATEVYIFDRYGRLLRKFNPLYSQWDGTYNGNPMPATDYWFKGVLENGLVFKGHFSLMRGQN